MLVFIFWYIIPIVKVLQVIPQETTLPKLFSWLSYDEKKNEVPSSTAHLIECYGRIFCLLHMHPDS